MKDGRSRLRELARLHQVFSVAEAAEILKLPRRATARRLAHWNEQGWVSRLRRGLYVVVPIDADPSKSAVADPWVVLAKVFEPCYIGGWSACEHWGLTEQMFRAIIVITSRRVEPRRGELAGVPYIAKRVARKNLFGTARVWRDQTPVDVSDPHRTLVDILDAPALGGGGRHIAQVVAAYFRSEHRKDRQLLAYVRRLGNRSVYKRLGFLVEALDIQAANVVSQCMRNLSAGYSRLDPDGPMKGRLLRRWRLLVNVEVEPTQ